MRETDIALVREGRKGLGDGADLLIDAGLVWDSKTALQRARAFSDYNIFWLEEPLRPDSPLRRLENAVLTSHLGWPADSTYRTMAEGMVSIIEAYLDGRYDKALNPEALKNRR